MSPLHHTAAPRVARPAKSRILEDRAVPATFTVNSTLDNLIAGDGKLTLREAITRANDLAGADVIVMPAGVYKIAISGAGEDGNATGDLDVTDTVTIRGGAEPHLHRRPATGPGLRGARFVSRLDQGHPGRDDGP